MVSKLYRAFLDDRFFTTQEALGLFPSKDVCMHTVKHLLNTRQIAKVRKGLYEIIPPGPVGKEKPSSEKFLLARKVTSPYCLAYHSALEIHGVANSAIYNIVYITSPNQFRNFKYEGVQYRWIPRKKLTGTEKTIWSTAQIIVTDRERTILDCIDRIDLAGGFEEVFKSLSSMINVNFDRLYHYAKNEQKKVLFHKLGFFISIKQIREAWNIDDQKLNKIKQHLSSKVYYFEASKGEGKFVKVWNLIVPSNIEEVMTFA
jgi:predicted transcriptional regulator of viral defense system